MFRAGNVLVSLRNINTILILDPTTRSTSGSGGLPLSLQHHPTSLPNGNLLIFDNGVERSSVLELDPVARRVGSREYEADDFFSMMRGMRSGFPTATR